jgi:uncharacterized protein YqiB (DUF1249 family)
MQQIPSQPRALAPAVQRTLPGLMALYEENYIRLRNLVPRPDVLAAKAVSRVDGCIDLHVEVVELARYTSTLRLTYIFDGPTGPRHEPDLLVRVQHDARTAEAMAVHMPRGLYRFDARRTLERCWQRNRFLHKWLGYCLRRGHHFPVAPRSPSVERARCL